MGILICLKYIPTRGEDRKSDSLWSTIDGLRDAGFSVVLATQGRAETTDFPCLPLTRSGIGRFGFRVAKKIASRQGWTTMVERLDKKKIARAVKHWEKSNGQIDAVVALCTGKDPALLGHTIATLLRRPLLVREHTNYEARIKSVDDISADYLMALRSADTLVAVSPLLAEIMAQVGVRPDIGVIPNAISDEFFQAPKNHFDFDWVESSQSARDIFVFGGWTRWREFKRVDLLLTAFRWVYAQHPNTRLLIAGPIEPESNARWAENYLNENGLEGVVRLTGPANREQIHKIAHSIDSCVVSSDYETFGLPALEALAAGKPVVTTRCNGPEWLVSNERFGRCVERGSSTELAQAMIDVYRCQDEFDSDFISSETRKKFSRTAVSLQWSDAIQRAAAKRNLQI